MLLLKARAGNESNCTAELRPEHAHQQHHQPQHLPQHPGTNQMVVLARGGAPASSKNVSNSVCAINIQEADCYHGQEASAMAGKEDNQFSESAVGGYPETAAYALPVATAAAAYYSATDYSSAPGSCTGSNSPGGAVGCSIAQRDMCRSESIALENGSARSGAAAGQQYLMPGRDTSMAGCYVPINYYSGGTMNQAAPLDQMSAIEPQQVSPLGSACDQAEAQQMLKSMEHPALLSSSNAYGAAVYGGSM